MFAAEAVQPDLLLHDDFFAAGSLQGDKTLRRHARLDDRYWNRVRLFRQQLVLFDQHAVLPDHVFVLQLESNTHSSSIRGIFPDDLSDQRRADARITQLGRQEKTELADAGVLDQKVQQNRGFERPRGNRQVADRLTRDACRPLLQP